MRSNRFESSFLLALAIAVLTSTGAASASELETACAAAVQGKVAWNQAGATGWNAVNLQNLCAGTTNPTATIACFEAQIRDHDDWARAIAACAAGAPTASVPGAATQTAGEAACANAIQGKVAWNRAGQTGWDAANLRNLCAGATNTGAIVACFQGQIAAHDDWRRGIEACRGAGSVAATAAPPAPDCECFGGLNAAEKQYLTTQLAAFRDGATATAATPLPAHDWPHGGRGGMGKYFLIQIAGIADNLVGVQSARCWLESGAEARVDFAATTSDYLDWTVCDGEGGNFSLVATPGPELNRFLEWVQAALAPGSNTDSLKRDITIFQPPQTFRKGCLLYSPGETATTIHGALPVSQIANTPDTGARTDVVTFSVERITSTGWSDPQPDRDPKTGEIRAECASAN